MIEIDGSQGEGGGQVLRSALALSMVTGKPFRISKIRGGRSKRGLLRQHLTAVEAASRISAAECSPVVLGSTELEFCPGKVEGGNFRFVVGTAGSAMLVLQTILPPLLTSKERSTVIVEGGTHAKNAPPFEFFEQCFVPIIERMGPRIETRLLQHGFFPAGGGRVEVQIAPVDRLGPVDISERGKLASCDSKVLIAGIPNRIARQENEAAKRTLGWEEEVFSIDQLPDSRGPGNVLLLTARFEHSCEISSGFGELGVPAFRVGTKTANRMKGFLESNAAIGPYLADQLLLPMALAGSGRFTTVKPSEHSRTNAAIIEVFTGVPIRFEQMPDGEHLCLIGTHSLA